MAKYLKALKRTIKAHVKGLQQITLSLWAFSIFYPELNFIFYVFAGISFIQVTLEKGWRINKITKEKAPYIFLLLFVLWNIITLIYTEDLYHGIKQVEKKIPLLVISILGLFGSGLTVNLRKILSYCFYGLLSVIIVCIIYSSYMLFTDYYLAVALVKGFTSINLLNIFEHRLYIGMSILMIIPFLIEEIVLEKKIPLRISKIIILLLSFYMVYSSGSRILMVSMIAIGLILLYKYLKPKINNRIFFTVFFVSIVAGLIILSFHPRTKLTWELISKNKSLTKLDNRFVTWDNALEIISDHPIFGTGLGDSKNEMFKAYKRNGNTFELQNKLNVHNQYLQIILESGFIGFFLFLFFVYSFYQGAKEKRIYVQTVLIIFGFSFLIESVLSRNLGVFPLTFWVFILLLTDKISTSPNYKDTKKLENIVLNTSAVLILGLVFAMLLFSKLKTFDSTDPKTYMTIPFNYVHYNNLPNKDQLPKVTDACSISLNDNFTNYERGIFLAPEVFSTKIDARVSLTYGIWCYISTDSNINEAYTYAWDRVNVSFRDEYDLTKKGTWQFLSLNDKTFSNSFAAGVRIDLRREFPKMEGKVYFAMPHFKIKNE